MEQDPVKPMQVVNGRIYFLDVTVVIFKEMIWSSWHPPQLKFFPSIRTYVAISWLFFFFLPDESTPFITPLRVQRNKCFQKKCVEAGMGCTESACRVIVVKTVFPVWKRNPLALFCPASPTSLRSFDHCLPYLHSSFFLFFLVLKLRWLRKWKGPGWLESTLTILPSGPSGGR